METKSPERKFLHDIASPLATAIFLIDILLEKFKAEQPDCADVSQLSTVMESLLQIKSKLTTRRETILGEQPRTEE
jgi:uncharacterized protein (DUF1800 family)